MHIRKLTESDARAFREIRIEMCGRHPEAFGQTPEEVAEMPDDSVGRTCVVEITIDEVSGKKNEKKN